MASLFWLNATIALWSVASLPWLGTLPIRVAELIAGSRASWGAVVRGEMVLVGSTILVPTLAMGAMFPLAVALVHRGVGASGAEGESHADRHNDSAPSTSTIDQNRSRWNTLTLLCVLWVKRCDYSIRRIQNCGCRTADFGFQVQHPPFESRAAVRGA